ncbi:GIN domain-containing protein [Terricaulis sp.]|uniref:GIN domain-containing protein n=1 Tax=Terricaulis sp. TaxID=2768686 RepID=UPI0037838659
MRVILLAIAGLGVMAVTANAETYPARSVDIRYAAANITVIPENRTDIAADVAAGGRVQAPSVRLDGGRLVIDGGLRNRIRGCSDGAVQINGLGRVNRTELPRITLRVPQSLDLHVGGAAFTSIGESAGGRAAFSGCGDTQIEEAHGALTVALDGSGDVRVTRVSGDLHASLDGSGDLNVGPVGGDAEASLDGSGDLTVASVAGAAAGSLDGSGDLNVGAVGASARVSLDGSGDVEFGSVRAGLQASVDGSGNIQVAAVEGGQVALALDGSGDVLVRSGAAERLSARNGGSGNVAFRGRVATLVAEIEGSGDIRIDHVDHVETLRDSGSGSVNFGS